MRRLEEEEEEGNEEEGRRRRRGMHNTNSVGGCDEATPSSPTLLKLNRVSSARMSPRRRMSVVFEQRRGGSFRAPPRTKVLELDYRSSSSPSSSVLRSSASSNNSSSSVIGLPCRGGLNSNGSNNSSGISTPVLPAAVTIEGASPEEGEEDEVFTAAALSGYDLKQTKKYRKSKVMNGGDMFEDSSPEPELSPWESNLNQEVFKYDRQKRRPSAFADQFDEFVYKSQHMAHSSEMEMENPHGYFPQDIPPEVNIEIPSDSDSSRRASKASYGMRLSNASSMNNMAMTSPSPIRTPGSQPSAPPNSIVHKPRKLSSSSPASKSPPHSGGGGGSNFLAARSSGMDRRSSHTGILTRNSPSSSSVHHYSRRSIMNSPKPNTLIVPKRRSRGSSLPGNIILDQEDIYRLRNFSMSGKKVINRGDSLKTTKSNHSINSTGSSNELRGSSHRSSSVSAEDFSSAASSRRPSKGSRRSSHRYAPSGSVAAEGPPAQPASDEPPHSLKVYKVAMLGASGVGKSSLTSQFLSSDDMNTYDTVEDDVQKTVSLSVDGNESKLVFIDHSSTDMSVENQVFTYEPDGYIVVYAIDESESLKRAEGVLQYLKSEAIIEQHAVILVANKTDLVRSRVVSTNSGKAVAIKYGCKYIETSPGINHNVDELLVGMLTQIQLRVNQGAMAKETKQNGGSGGGGGGAGFKILDLMEKMRDWTESLFTWIRPNFRGTTGGDVDISSKININLF